MNEKPRISEALEALGAKFMLRNGLGRGPCPIHGGQSQNAFSFNNGDGVWFCHRCAEGGDVVRLIERVLDTDFRGACAWMGLTPDRPPQPDPERKRQRKAVDGLRAWAKRLGRELRDEFYTRDLIITRALDRLRRDAEDSWAWNWLAWALPTLQALEQQLDTIDLARYDDDLVIAWREWRRAGHAGQT